MQSKKKLYESYSFSSAFTMIELVFVIVVLGILAAVAIPRFSATRTDAQISKARADVSSIRSAIITERQSRLITGQSSFIPTGTGTYIVGGRTYKQMDNGGLFGGVLTYPIAASTGNSGWSSPSAGSYVYKIDGVSTPFDYNATSGIFDCSTGTYCSDITD